MPNGGYPINLILTVGGSDLILRLEGSTIQVVRTEDGGHEPDSSVGQLTDVQACALLFHLNYWGAPNTSVDFHGVSSGWFGTERLEPKFTAPGCRYEL
jgi:hypothetical protein